MKYEEKCKQLLGNMLIVESVIFKNKSISNASNSMIEVPYDGMFDMGILIMCNVHSNGVDIAMVVPDKNGELPHSGFEITLSFTEMDQLLISGDLTIHRENNGESCNHRLYLYQLHPINRSAVINRVLVGN